MQVLLVGALVQRGLARRYPFFVAYLAGDAIGSIVLMQLEFQSPAYARVFRLYQMTVIILRLGVAGEIYERICEHFLGIGVFRVYLAAGLLATTGAISFGVFRPHAPMYIQTCALLIERWETTALCIAFATTGWLITRFFNVYPSMRPNVQTHWKLLTAYFAISAVTSASVILWRAFYAQMAVNLLLMAGDLVCFAAWIKFLTVDGEKRPPAVRLSAEELSHGAHLRRRVLEYVKQAGR